MSAFWNTLPNTSCTTPMQSTKTAHEGLFINNLKWYFRIHTLHYSRGKLGLGQSVYMERHGQFELDFERMKSYTYKFDYDMIF